MHPDVTINDPLTDLRGKILIKSKVIVLKMNFFYSIFFHQKIYFINDPGRRTQSSGGIALRK